MIKFINKFIINEDIEKVWEFYTDIRHLEIITPKKLNLKIGIAFEITVAGIYMVNRGYQQQSAKAATEKATA